jgi:hypothetical protein
LCKPDQPNRIHPPNPITRTVRANWLFGWLMDMISLNPTWSGRIKYYPQTRLARPVPTPKYYFDKSILISSFHTHIHMCFGLWLVKIYYTIMPSLEVIGNSLVLSRDHRPVGVCHLWYYDK